MSMPSAVASCSFIGVSAGQRYYFDYSIVERDLEANNINHTYTGGWRITINNVSTSGVQACNVSITHEVAGGNMSLYPDYVSLWNVSYIVYDSNNVNSTVISSRNYAFIISTTVWNKSYSIEQPPAFLNASWDDNGVLLHVHDYYENGQNSYYFTLDRSSTLRPSDWLWILLLGILIGAIIVAIAAFLVKNKKRSSSTTSESDSEVIRSKRP